MTEASHLGPVTEARFAIAFEHKAVVTKTAAASLIGIDEKTLDALSQSGVVRSIPKGKLRAYTERDLRAYLLEGRDVECRSTSQPRAASGSTTSSTKLVAFTDLLGKRLDAQRKRSSGSSGSTPRKAG